MAASSKTILVAGASGLVGSALTSLLSADGHRVIHAVRRPSKNPEDELQWNPASGQLDLSPLKQLDAVVHLGGANIAGKRWSSAYKQQLLESRVQSTSLLSAALAKRKQKPEVFACASAIGYYGDRGDQPLTESASSGTGFLPEVCLQWENATHPARDAGIRVANLRFGVVLSPHGGALASMLLPFKLGLGGIIGNGKQYFSWITLDDAAQTLKFVLENQTLDGPVNCVTPNAVTNQEFTKALGRSLSRPTFLPMPAFAARLAFGEMADALLLASARVVPEKLTAAGFPFLHPDLQPALEHLLRSCATP